MIFSRRNVLVSATAAALLATACSAQQSTEGEADSTTITVAEYPVTSNAAAHIGVKEGIFEEAGLNVEFHTITAGAAAIPTLLRGDVTFVPIDVPSAVNATLENMGIVAVATMTVGDSIDRGYAGVVGKPDAIGDGWKSLEGQKVAVNALGGSAQVIISASMLQDGADPTLVEWVELAPPETVPALLAGRVDMAHLAEPLLTAAEDEGFVQLDNPEKAVPDIPTFIYVASKQFVDENPETVTKFQEAMQKANAKANEDHDLVVEVSKETTTVDPGVLEEMKGFPKWGDKPLTAEDVQKFMEIMIQAGVLDESQAPSASDVVSAQNQ